MFSVTVNRRDLERLELDTRRIKDIREPLRESVAYQERSTRENFLRETSPDNNPWQRLKVETLVRKRTNAILRETMSLINGIRSRTFDDYAIIESPVRYSIFHQKGTRKTAKREFLGFSDRDVRQIRNIFNRYIERKLK